MGMAGTNKSDLFSLGVIAYEMLTGELPYGEQLNKDMNWRSACNIKYTTALKYNPMIPLWLDGALEKAVRCDHRMRYDTYSEFIHDLTHPNESFMKQNIPLIEKDPVKVWQIISTILFGLNILLLYVIFS